MHGLGWRESQGPMGPMAVVVSGEDVKDMLELLVVHDQEPVQARRANGPHEPLRHAVCLRSTKRRANDLNSIASEYPIEAVREFLILVANQTLHGCRPVT
jgi:hypothetical protein